MFGIFSALFDDNESLTYKVTSPYGRTMAFRFRFSFVDQSWRAYILESPDYGQRSTSMHDTHRYYDRNSSLHYVCWTRSLSRLADIIEVSKLWARKTAKYIDTGERF